MPLPKIVRKIGPYKRRYGILLENLKPYQRNILYKNPLCEEYFKNDDQFTLIIFKIAEMEINRKNERKVYYNPYRDIISDVYTEVIEDSKKVDWQCAICDDSIKSIISEFHVSNLICDKCNQTHGNTSTVDARIVLSSIDFKNYCKQLLLKEQSGYLKYVRKFEKGH